METLQLIASGLGTLLVAASAIDMIIPDNIDHGFYKKLEKNRLVKILFDKLISFSVLRAKK